MIPLILAASLLLEGGLDSVDGLTGCVTIQRVEWSEPAQDPAQSLRIWMRIRLENHSDTALIVPRRINPPVAGRVRSDSGGGNEYELWGGEIYGSVPKATFGPVPDTDRFVLLAPGEVFETLATTGVLVNFSKEEIPRTVRLGATVSMDVRIDLVPTKPMKPDATVELQKKWRSTGRLIVGSFWSGTFTVVVPSERGTAGSSLQPPLESCGCSPRSELPRRE